MCRLTRPPGAAEPLQLYHSSLLQSYNIHLCDAFIAVLSSPHLSSPPLYTTRNVHGVTTLCLLPVDHLAVPRRSTHSQFLKPYGICSPLTIVFWVSVLYTQWYMTD